MNITTNNDDFPLLLEVMQRLGLPGIIDNHLRRHGLQGPELGLDCHIWLAIFCARATSQAAGAMWVRQRTRRLIGSSG